MEAWIPVVAVAVTVIGTVIGTYLRDRNNPMSQVVEASVQSTLSTFDQLRHYQARATHYEAYARLLAKQLRDLGETPHEEPFSTET